MADIDRPLNKRGKRDAPEMGRRLKTRGILPELLISSPAKRAFKTAKEVSKSIGYPIEQILVEGKMYHSGPSTLLDIVRFHNKPISSLMIFGHNPGFTSFANALGDLDIDNVPTAGIVAFSFEKDWKQIRYGDGKLVFFDYPKKPFK